MAQVFPFRAYRYNPARVELGRVLTQPYDKITTAMQEKYYAADPHNLIVIEKGRALPSDTPQDNVYTRAAAALERWIAEGVITQDTTASFYAYFQEYSVPGTHERRTRKGFIGLGKLEDYSAGVVFRHEQTLSAPKADRLELLRHTRAQTGQLFMLYSDAERRIDALLEEVASSATPAVHVRDEYGVVHRLWPIADAARVSAIQELMAPRKLVIADGHHRYETALAYRDECRAKGARGPDAAYERAMMTFLNTHSEGLTILPTHRLVANLRNFSWERMCAALDPYFQFAPFFFSYGNEAERAAQYALFLEQLAAQRSGCPVGLYAGTNAPSPAYYLLKPWPDADLGKLLRDVSPLQRELDVVLLHRAILEGALGITPQAVTAEANLSYEREAEAAIAAVDRGAAQLAFLLNPVAVEQVMRIATASEVLPQKSTDFYPKLLSGLTMYRL
jgi:uncharacterized protein (DUF1015 family)